MLKIRDIVELESCNVNKEMIFNNQKIEVVADYIINEMEHSREKNIEQLKRRDAISAYTKVLTAVREYSRINNR